MSRNADQLVSNLTILKQYIDVIQQFKIKKEELDLILGNENTLPYKLYKGIADKRYPDDETAAQQLYQQKPNAPAYKMLKSELKKKLMHAVLVLDSKQPEFNDVQQAYYQCQKNWATINVLTGRFKNDAAIDLAQITLELAQKFEWTETVANTSRFLALKFHLHRPLSRTTENYDKIYEEAYTLLDAENLAIRYYDDISRHAITMRIPQLHLSELAIKYLSELRDAFNKYDSHRLHLSVRLIEIYSYTCANDFAGAYHIAMDAIAFFESKPYQLKNQLAIFLRHKTHCCMLLRRFEEGEESAKRSRDLTEIGTHNWYRDSLLYVQFCLHIENYQKAWEIYIEMLEHRNYREQNVVVLDEMSIFNAYLQYFISAGKVSVLRKDKTYIRAFDANEFLSSLKAVLPNSKTGAKAPVLVAQLLWILKEKETDIKYWLDQCLASLGRYREHHTSETEYSYRTHLFVVLCAKLAMRETDTKVMSREKAEKAGRRVFEKLKAAPQHFPTQAHSLEVLPYDIAWAEVLQLLPEK